VCPCQVPGLDSAKVSTLQTPDRDTLHTDTLERGRQCVLSSIQTQEGLWLTILSGLSSYWQAALLSLLSTMILSLVCAGLLHTVARPTLLATTLLCPVVLTVVSTGSTARFATSSDYTWLALGILTATLTLSLSLVLIRSYRIIYPAISIIAEAMQDLQLSKTVFSFLLLELLASMFLICLCLTITCLLATSLTLEYRVVDGCLSETCINTATGRMFVSGDTCHYHTFQECSGCPKAQCLYHSMQSSVATSVLHCVNLCCALWCLYTVQALVAMALLPALSTSTAWHCSTRLGSIHTMSRILLYLPYLLMVGLIAIPYLVINQAHQYHSVLSVIIILGVFFISGGPFSIHIVLLDTFLLCFLEDWEKQDKVRNSKNSFKNVAAILGLDSGIVGEDNPISMDIIAEESQSKTMQNVHQESEVLSNNDMIEN